MLAIVVAATNRLGAASKPATVHEPAVAPPPAPIPSPPPQWPPSPPFSPSSPPPHFRRRGVCRCRPRWRRPRHLHSPPPRHHQLHHRPSRRYRYRCRLLHQPRTSAGAAGSFSTAAAPSSWRESAPPPPPGPPRVTSQPTPWGAAVRGCITAVSTPHCPPRGPAGGGAQGGLGSGRLDPSRHLRD